jgi:hypothetical protein
MRKMLFSALLILLLHNSAFCGNGYNLWLHHNKIETKTLSKNHQQQFRTL